ncbi:LacI family DNA-binding transcriptional regulator [Micromonospora soli]|uniref:LacI family DNA-binding transcriptional regulator n=1 Tax=Micromonospora sp. NBRC 110009 TaxID=3061627 RepID=UPI002671095A|nr:LacI family DNA-binding transcriptional regulator [Micromonospora sp. NBRC 110009]WKU02374.1 LacI family DNA-binding transcriptional regulator [Micromonospora sp. NBRC 110009]
MHIRLAAQIVATFAQRARKQHSQRHRGAPQPWDHGVVPGEDGVVVDLRQVAAVSGVSLSTASRALSGSGRVSDATRQRVRRVAEDLGYRPNALARGLRTSHSRLIGLVVTNLVNASFHAIAEVVHNRLKLSGYHLVLCITGGDVEEERAYVETLRDHNVDGVIVVGSDATAVEQLRATGIPTVHLARQPRQPAGDCVLGADLEGAREATRYLLGLSHRRIALVAGPSAVTSGYERLAGYRLAMDEAGVPCRDELIFQGPLEPASGVQAVARLIALPARRRPTAVLVTNHESAFGLLPTLRERRVRIPDDLSVLCYEDADLLRWWDPAITVMNNNAARMGELAVNILLERIAAKPGADGAMWTEYRVGAQLVVRDSCAVAES